LREDSVTREGKLFWLLCALGFGLFWSSFNLLNGMQISFYFADLAMLLSLLLMLRWKDWRSGIGLILLMVLGLGSMGSALAIPFATGVFQWLRPQNRPGFVPCWLGTVALALLYVFVPGGTGMGHLPDPWFTAQFIMTLAAWPLPVVWWGAVVILGGLALLIRPRLAEQHAAIAVGLTLGTFGLLNDTMLALHRTPDEFHSRHWDSVGWLPFGVVIILLVFIRLYPAKPLVRLASLGGIGVISGAILLTFIQTAWPVLQASHSNRAEVVLFYQKSLLSGKFQVQSDQINQQLIDRDYTFFDDPVARYGVHPYAAHNIAAAPVPALALLSPDILPVRSPSLIMQAFTQLLRFGWALAALGFGLFACSCSTGHIPKHSRE
jgi:hypothetical protein